MLLCRCQPFISTTTRIVSVGKGHCNNVYSHVRSYENRKSNFVYFKNAIADGYREECLKLSKIIQRERHENCIIFYTFIL